MQFRHKRIEEFANGIKGKKNVYCFGAGAALTNFLQEFQEYHIEDEIKGVVDNSGEKQGTMIQGSSRAFLIISLNQMLQEISLGDVILITTTYFSEIIQLLNDEEKLKNTDFYLHRMLRIEQYDYDRLNIPIPQSLSVYREQKIPKVIHYCWFGGSSIPGQHRLWMKSWKEYCPDYEIIEWNEKNYDVRKNRYLCQAYERGKWAFVSDYVRMDIVNEYGGIYLDTDVELLKNLDEMLKNDAFCGFESSRYVAYGLGFGARSHQPIVNEIKKYYDNTSFVLEDGTLNQVTCPVIQTEVMKKHGLICNGEFQVVEGMTVYPSRILCGMSPHSFRIQRDLEYTYAIHHYTGSWLENVQGKKDTISDIKKWGSNDNYHY